MAPPQAMRKDKVALPPTVEIFSKRERARELDNADKLRRRLESPRSPARNFDHLTQKRQPNLADLPTDAPAVRPE